MKNNINRVGLSWIYDYIKFDLISIYNQLKSTEVSTEKSIDINVFRSVDIKFAHLSKVFYLLDIPAGVYVINEFRLSLSYILQNIDKLAENKLEQKTESLTNNIEHIMNYIDDIIQGYGDLPIYYVNILDELRLIREATLFSQCSYIVNSVKQQNISDYVTSFSSEKIKKISSALSKLNKNILEIDFHQNSIADINIIKTEFEGTQHYLLWELVGAVCTINNHYKSVTATTSSSNDNTNSDSGSSLEVTPLLHTDIDQKSLVANYIVNQIIHNYDNVFDTINFEKIAKMVPCWIGTLCFCLISSNNFFILEKSTQEKILSILVFHAKKSIANYITFAERMLETDGWILVLDIASELDIAIERLDEIKRKKRADINWLLELLQKHIDSCIFTGTYDVLEDYYETVNNIHQYTITGGFISGDDLEIMAEIIRSLINSIEDSVTKSKDFAEQEEEIDEKILEENDNLNQINRDSQRQVYKEQSSDLEKILAKLEAGDELKVHYVNDSLNQVLKTFTILSFNSGISIIKLYLEKLTVLDENTIISSSLKDNVIVFVKYLIETVRALYIGNNYITYIKLAKKLVDNLEVALLDEQNNSKTTINLKSEKIDHKTDEIVDTTTSIQPENKVNNPQKKTAKYKDHGFIINIFFEEAKSLLEDIRSSFSIFQQEILKKNTINTVSVSYAVSNILRELHTLKGSTRMAGFISLGDLVHYIENLFEQCRLNSEDITQEDVNKLQLLINEVDKTLVQYEQQFNHDHHNFIERLDDLVLCYDQIILDCNNKNITEDSISVAGIINQQDGINVKDLKSNSDQDNLSRQDDLNSLLQLRQSIRIHKKDYDKLLDQACALIINQQQIIKQVANYKNILNQLEFLKTSDSMHDNKIFSILAEKMHSYNFQLENSVNESNKNIAATFDDLFILRMVPLDAIKSRIEYLVQSVSKELNKQVDFNLVRAEGKVDSFILETIAPCLDHIIRNAIYHGIEDKDIRIMQGKNQNGAINIEIYTKNDLLHITIADDGAGMNINDILTKAKEKNVLQNNSFNFSLDENNNISPEKLLEIITTHGFSTSDILTSIAGRGVGLDVVKNIINKLSGILELETTPNKGTRFIIKIPSSLAKQKLQFLQINDLTYAIPDLTINMVATVSGAEIQQDVQTGKRYYLDSEIYSMYNLLNLDEILSNSLEECVKQNINELDPSSDNNFFTKSAKSAKDTRYNSPELDANATYHIIIVKYNDKRYGFIVDKVLDANETVVRPLTCDAPLYMKNMLEVMGVTVTNHGDIVLVLDILKIITRLQSPQDSLVQQNNSYTASVEQLCSTEDKNITHKYNILAVEDSATLRHIIAQYIGENADYKLFTAVDGLDALDKIKQVNPDLIILDISMPRMNGLEFLKEIRMKDLYKTTPVIITTSREEEAFKELAMQMNVDVYLKKPYDKSKLLNAINYALTS